VRGGQSQGRKRQQEKRSRQWQPVRHVVSPPAESRFQRGECSIAPEGDKQYAAHGTAEIAFPWGTSGAGVCCAYAQSDFWEES
jgi:hypothetical protein